MKELIKISNNKMEAVPLTSNKNKIRFASYDDSSSHAEPVQGADSNEGESRALLQRQAQVARLDDELNFQDGIIKDRDTQIRALHGEIVQVNEIFKDLARIVGEQGTMIDSIQNNISSANTNVEAGLNEVKEADKHQQSSRKKLCFLAIFVTVIVAVIVVVLVVTLGGKKS